MLSDKRLLFALTTSVLLNAGCVAVVGEAALQRRQPHPLRSTASLHPAALQLAASTQTAALNSTDEAGSGEPSRQADADSETGQANGNPANDHGSNAGREYKMDYRLSKADAAAMNTADTLERRLNSGQPLTASQKNRLAQIQQQLYHTAVQALTHQALVPQNPPLASHNQPLASQKQSSSSNRQMASRHSMTIVTRPSIPGRNSHAGEPGNSIAPKMVKYPKMKLDLGTIHMTRPKHGVTGGGSSDLREVEITAHYVVDDPNNVPKTLLPDKIIKMFASNCNGDPGNTSRCIPTGGNTRLGGTVLHGKHDHITGVKYCLPGGGGIPGGGGGGGSQSQAVQIAAQGRQNGRPGGTAGGHGTQGKNGKDYGPLVGSQQIISQRYPGGDPAPPLQMAGWQPGHMNPNEVSATTINALHLPAAHSDSRGLVPGAEVPILDRKWVSNPKAHQVSAPPGVQAIPLPRFRVSPHNIGSMSRFGTISWGRPVKNRPKKQPYGGDGTGLLGMYYRGNNFDQLVMTRPDRNIDYDWSAGPPDPHIPPTAEYSVRWEGKLVPKVTDTYTLMTGADDGVRLYLDDRLLISNWTVHSPTEDTVTVPLIAGHAYKIKVEYYENGYGYAAMKLYWQSPRVSREYIPEECLRYPRVTDPAR